MSKEIAKNFVESDDDQRVPETSLHRSSKRKRIEVDRFIDANQYYFTVI